MTSDKTFLIAAGIMGFLAVAGGAFGAHALKTRVSPEALSIFETAVRYHMYHALAVGGVGMLVSRYATPQLSWAGWLFIAGTAIFSGSLYVLTLTGTRWWGAVTPVGGVLLLAGWGCIVWGMIRS